MAIITTPENPWDSAYWIIRNMDYRRGEESTLVNLGGYLSQAQRAAQGMMSSDSRIVDLPGEHSRASAYAAILALPEWAGATGDE